MMRRGLGICSSGGGFVLCALLLGVVVAFPGTAQPYLDVGIVFEGTTPYDTVGDEIALSGSSLVTIAAQSDSIRIFERDAGGPWRWQEQTELFTSAGGFNALGRLDADLGLLGVVLVDIGETRTNFIEVFERSDAEGWVFRQRLEVIDPTDLAGFGDVAIDGDRLVGGSPLDGDVEVGSGAVRVYERDSVESPWVEVAKIKGDVPQNNERFGAVVASDEDRVLAGAYRNSDLLFEAGAAYLFERSELGEWEQVAKLQPSEPQVEGWFGFSVALDGDVAVVGAEFEDGGAAYVFEKIGDEWVSIQRLTGDASALFFGRSVAVEGDAIVVGSENGALLFQRSEEGDWESQPLKAEEVRDRYDHGDSVAISNGTVAVGAPSYDGESLRGGAVFLYRALAEPLASLTGECLGEVELAVSGGSPGGSAVVVLGTTLGSGTIPGGRCSGESIGVVDPTPLGELSLDENGAALATWIPDPALCGSYLQVIDRVTCGMGPTEQLPESRQPNS